MKISKSKLKRMVEQELKTLAEDDLELWSDDEEDHPAYAKDDELREVGTDIANLLSLTKELHQKLENMGKRYGELAHTGTHARMAQRASETLSEKFKNGLNNIGKY